MRLDAGDPTGALDDARHVLRTSPHHAEALAVQARALAKVAAPAHALAAFDQAIAGAPGDVNLRWHRAQLRLATHRGDGEPVPAGALADLDAVLAAEPSRAEAWHLRGVARAQHGDHAGAEKNFTRTIAIDAVNVPAYQDRAAARWDQGDDTGAEADCDQIIALGSAWAGVYAARGAFRMKRGNLLGARADFDEPSRLQTYVDLAGVYTRAGDPASAVQVCDLAVKRTGQVWLARADASLQRDDIDGVLRRRGGDPARARRLPLHHAAGARGAGGRAQRGGAAAGAAGLGPVGPVQP